MNSEFIRFLFSGGIAALVNWLSRIMYSLWLDYTVAVAVAYLTGMVTAYVLFRLFVFGRGQNSIARSVSYYILVNGAALTLTWLTSVGLGLYLFPSIDFTWYPLEVAHAIGVAVPAISSYFGHKYFSFR
jgi:putative flippase GtrA